MQRQGIGKLWIGSLVLLWPLAQGIGADEKRAESPVKGDATMSFTIASAAFSNGQPIPSKHTVDGPDVSPPLQWTSPPANTKALVLIGEDPDAFGRTWVHWVLYDIPPATTNLPEALPRGDVVLGSAKQGQTDFTGREPGYWGPALPPGYTHRYFFRLYAVDQLAGLPARATKAQVMEAIQGHVLARAEIMGTYRRIQR